MVVELVDGVQGHENGQNQQEAPDGESTFSFHFHALILRQLLNFTFSNLFFIGQLVAHDAGRDHL